MSDEPAAEPTVRTRIWKILKGPFIAIWLFSGTTLLYADHTASTRPDPATGRIYPVQSHGGYLYVTPFESWVYYETAVLGIATIAGAVVIAFIAKSREM